MRRFIAIVSAAALSVVLLAPGVRAYGEETSIVATPGSAAYGYVTPVVTAGADDALVFENLDSLSSATGPHDVTSLQTTAEGEPLFSSPTFHGVDAREIEVRGPLDPGRAYRFRCSVHPFTMNGLLVIEPA